MADEYIGIPMYRRYRAKVRWSDEDGVYVGEVIGIKDLVCFHAEEKEAIMEMFISSVDNYLDCCEKIGKQADIPNY